MDLHRSLWSSIGQLKGRHVGGTGVSERFMGWSVLGETLMLPSHPVKVIGVEDLLRLCAVSLLSLTTWG